MVSKKNKSKGWKQNPFHVLFVVEEDEADGDLDAVMGDKGDLGSDGSRVIRKAKRTTRDRAYSTSEDSARFGPTGRAHQGPPRANKNMRKSRSGMGRGLPKKGKPTATNQKCSSILKLGFLGGAGGKGTWGKLGCELELPWIDPNDPNYESDSESVDSPNAVNGKSKSSNLDMKTLVPEMSEEDVRKSVEPLILEYFENSDRYKNSIKALTSRSKLKMFGFSVPRCCSPSRRCCPTWGPDAGWLPPS